VRMRPSLHGPAAPPMCPHRMRICVRVLASVQGKIQGNEFIVVDTFALPVEGTETRVNAGQEAYEYMVDFLETTKVGWLDCG